MSSQLQKTQEKPATVYYHTSDRIETLSLEKHSSPVLNQLKTVIALCQFQVSAGFLFGYTAIMLPQLGLEESSIKISKEESSWIASIATLPMGFACLIGGILMEKLGRRKLLMLVSILYTIGFCSNGVAESLPMLLVGRFLTGFCMGLAGPVVSVYIGEISDPKYRGIFSSTILTSFPLGILSVHIFGSYIHWKLAGVVCSIAPLISYVFLHFVPESPAWLLGKGQLEKSQEGFLWYRGNGFDATIEYEKMVERYNTTIELQKQQSKLSVTQQINVVLQKREFVQPFIVMLVYFMVLQLCGVNVFIFYTTSILMGAFKKNVDEVFIMIVCDSVRFAMGIMSSLCISKYGRRTLSLISCFVSAASLLLFSISLYIIQNIFETAEFLIWIPLIFLCIFVCFTSFGVVPLPWVMVGEILPVAHRGLGSGILACLNFSLCFVTIKISPYLFETLGYSVTFASSGIMTLIGSIFLYFKLPETKDKSLQQIEDEYNNRNTKNEN